MTAGFLDDLNPEQRPAAEYLGDAPLLVIAGAGSGKTTTLAHRVAALIAAGADPRRILLLTFTRRAAAEMSRRARHILARARSELPERCRELVWSGTFHAIANRVLRLHADAVRLDPAFTVLDRSDGEDLIDLVRNQLGLSRTARMRSTSSTPPTAASRPTWRPAARSRSRRSAACSTSR